MDAADARVGEIEGGSERVTDLSALLERLRAATGAEQELGALILCATLAPAGAYVEQSKFNGAWCIYSGEYRGRPSLWDRGPRPPHPEDGWNVTGDLTTALALVQAKLPGHGWVVGCSQHEPGKFFAELYHPEQQWEAVAYTSAPTSPLALLQALLVVLIAEQTSDAL